MDCIRILSASSYRAAPHRAACCYVKKGFRVPSLSSRGTLGWPWMYNKSLAKFLRFNLHYGNFYGLHVIREMMGEAHRNDRGFCATSFPTCAMYVVTIPSLPSCYGFMPTRRAIKTLDTCLDAIQYRE